MTPPRSHPNPKLRGWRFANAQGPSLLYRLAKRFVQSTVCPLWNVRVFNRHYEPAEGGVVYISNHQSFFDPILMSFALRRPMNFMARDSLFRFPGFGPLIHAVNAFPIRRGKADTGALKEAMRRLKRGGQVVVFAEGTRTRDGRIGPFLPGMTLLAQRAAKWIVPVVIDGAYEAWPRTQALPSPGNVLVQYAPPIPRDEVRRLKPDIFVNRVRDTLIELQADVRRRAGRPPLDYK